MIIKIIAIAIVGAVLSVILRQYKPEYAIGVAVACGIVLLTMLKDDIAAVLAALRTSADVLGIDTVYINTLIKIVGVAYLTQFGASVCEDAGEKAIAMKVELAGRLVIVLLSAPVLLALIKLITEILP